MKVPITLNIDAEKKAIFEALRPIHGKSFSDILDEALDSVIGEESPDTLIELQIQDAEVKLAQLKSNLVEAKFITAQRKAHKSVSSSKTKIKEDLEAKLETLRESKYIDNKISLATQVKRRSIDWKVIMNVFEFQSQSEAKVYVLDKLKADGMI